MKLEDMAYTFFGNNLVVGKHIKKQLAFLQGVLPAEMLDRAMDDLGCGDGKVTLLLKEILKPSKLRGYDIHQGNVKRAINRGIDAGNIDLDEYIPQGELAVVWGVLHHLQHPEHCLRRLKENYPFVLIREPVKKHIVNGLELGHPMRLTELICMFNNFLPDHKIYHFNGSVIVFYGCRDYQEKAYAPFFMKKSALVREPSLM